MSAVLEIKQPHQTVLRGQAFWWEQLRAKGIGAEFTVRDIDLLGRDHTASVRDFIRRLEAAGIVECFDSSIARGSSERKHYRLKKTPRNLPCLTRDGREGTQSLGQQFMWNFIRMGNSFQWRDLAAFSSTEEVSIDEQTAKRYGTHLLAAGYLITVKKGRPYHPGIYRLDPSKNHGPNAPMILRSKFVYDPNLRNVPGDIIAEVAQ